jgi:hypothetical protein
MAALLGQKLVDPVLGTNSKSGYTFAVTPTNAGVRPAQFFATAIPTTASGVGQTGTRRFGITEDGVMHGDATALTAYADGAAVQSAPALGN